MSPSPHAGYKATELLDSTNHLGAFTVGVCTKGSVSYWKADNSRVPTNGDACQSCADETAKNTYAPRAGASSSHSSCPPRSSKFPCPALASLSTPHLTVHH